jgi:hypothetical protein
MLLLDIAAILCRNIFFTFENCDKERKSFNLTGEQNAKSFEFI